MAKSGGGGGRGNRQRNVSSGGGTRPAVSQATAEGLLRSSTLRLNANRTVNGVNIVSSAFPSILRRASRQGIPVDRQVAIMQDIGQLPRPSGRRRR